MPLSEKHCYTEVVGVWIALCGHITAKTLPRVLLDPKRLRYPFRIRNYAEQKLDSRS